MWEAAGCRCGPSGCRFICPCRRYSQAFIFSDPANLYSTSIADSWVYQAYHSTPEIAVFTVKATMIPISKLWAGS